LISDETQEKEQKEAETPGEGIPTQTRGVVVIGFARIGDDSVPKEVDRLWAQTLHR
jgi:hypothetical protein